MMMKIVVGGQIDKEENCFLIEKQLGEKAVVTVKGESGCNHGYEDRTV